MVVFSDSSVSVLASSRIVASIVNPSYPSNGSFQTKKTGNWRLTYSYFIKTYKLVLKELALSEGEDTVPDTKLELRFHGLRTFWTKKQVSK